jgi:hypothetical protein
LLRAGLFLFAAMALAHARDQHVGAITISPDGALVWPRGRRGASAQGN